MGWGWGWGWDGMESNLVGWGWDGTLISEEGKNGSSDGMGWKDGMIFDSISIPSENLKNSRTKNITFLAVLCKTLLVTFTDFAHRMAKFLSSFIPWSLYSS